MAHFRKLDKFAGPKKISNIPPCIGIEAKPASTARLGNSSPNKTKPLKLKMNNENEEDIMGRLPNLKNAEDRLRRVSVTEDYTIEERKVVNKWIEKAKEKNRSKTLNVVWKLRCTPKNGIEIKQFPTAPTGKLSNVDNLRNNKDKNDSNISKNYSGVLNIWYTNADTLTKDIIQELKDDINANLPPDIIADTEIKPKNYIEIVEYKIDSYEFQSVNLKDQGSTKGVSIYF